MLMCRTAGVDGACLCVVQRAMAVQGVFAGRGIVHLLTGDCRWEWRRHVRRLQPYAPPQQHAKCSSSDAMQPMSRICMGTFHSQLLLYFARRSSRGFSCSPPAPGDLNM